MTTLTLNENLLSIIIAVQAAQKMFMAEVHLLPKGDHPGFLTLNIPMDKSRGF